MYRINAQTTRWEGVPARRVADGVWMGWLALLAQPYSSTAVDITTISLITLHMDLVHPVQT
jgi:hypothetical protein